MQRVELPSNINVLIAAGGTNVSEDGTKLWHHPTLSVFGDGIYLYSENQLRKQADWNTNTEYPYINMDDPNTLEQFLRYGEENFTADHRIIIFWEIPLPPSTGIRPKILPLILSDSMLV